MSALTRRRALRAVAPVAGLLAAGLLVWQGSYAAFSATTSNTANAWTTGNLALTNNGGVAGSYSGSTSAVFGTSGSPETAMKPGDTGVKCLTVDSNDTAIGTLKLYRGVFSGTNAATLAPLISLSVDAVTGAASVDVAANCAGYTGGTSGAVFNGTLFALGTGYGSGAGAVSLGASHQRTVYRIAWTLSASATSAVMGSTAQTDLTWEVQ